jgi:hypothetical protein
MIIKPRYESAELELLRCLNRRMNLPVTEVNYYSNLEKGFEGEERFDEWLENLSDDWLILNDLLLESNNTVFQIDTLLISQETTYLFEVKNYEGDFFIDADRWYTLSGSEIKNPLLQLKRSESLFRRLLQDLRFNSSIESYLIFVNPDFHLYQAPLNLPIIFPTQLNRFINKINKESFKLEDKHSKFAEQLVSIHLKKSPYTRLPDYTYDQIEKGITCGSCHLFIAEFTEKKLICNECGCREEVTTAVLRSVEEFKLLFPDRTLTTKAIYEWCKIIKSKKTIRRILSRNFKLMRCGRSSHYVNTQVNSD